MSLEIGQTVGDYQVVGVLGQGGMGSVYRVRNTLSERIEAMKVLLPNLRDVPELADRFLREIKVQAKLDHPNITALRTAFRENNQLLMVMELVDGSSLDKVRNERSLLPDEVVGYARQALEALSYAHSMGVIHRDLKPANMMLTSRGLIKLTDFGIAHDSADRKLTRTGVAIGSLYYISPEQVQGKVPDARSDVYSLGITLYELLTGELPFKCDTDYAMMTAHLLQQPEPPQSRKADIPAWLSDVVMKSIAKDPAHRFQSAAEFGAALAAGRAMTAQTVLAPSITPAAGTSATAMAAGRSKMYVIGGVAAVALAVGVALVVRPARSTSGAADVPATTASVPPSAAGAGAESTPSSVPATTSAAASASRVPATSTTPPSRDAKVAASSTNALSVVPPRNTVGSQSSTSVVPTPKPQVESPASTPTSPLNVAQVQSAPLSPPPVAPPPNVTAPPPNVTAPPASAVAAPKVAAKDPRLEEWERLSGTTDVGGLEAFRRRASDQYSQLAEKRIEELEWNAAQGSRDPQRLRAFRERHPRSAHAIRAASEADRIERESAGRAVQDALNRYKAAFEGRDIAAVRAIWPALGGSQAQAIENGFKNSKSIRMTLAMVGEPQIQGNSATVTCSRKQVIQTRSGPPLTPEHTVTFRLRKAGDGWVIDSIQ